MGRNFASLLALVKELGKCLFLHGMAGFHRVRNIPEEAASVADVLIMKHPAGVSLLVKQVAIAVK